MVGTFGKILLILLSIGLIGWLFRFVKMSPQSFSRSNLNKSFWSMGILALLLIGFIALCVLLLRAF